MLDPASWRHYTAQLELGRSSRVEHDCGEGRTLKVEHKPEGFSAYCWRCADKGWIPHAPLSLSERIAKLRAAREQELVVTASLVLPQPMELDPQAWPLTPRVWLYKAGLSNDDITGLGFYYCERIDRVVMPIHQAGKLVYWQARGFDKGKAKYINPIVNRDALFAKFGTGSPLVLTEDLLSAYRVSRVTQAWALLGTSMSDTMVSMIAGLGLPVATMLDPDAGGDKGRVATYRKLSLLGVKVVQLHPDKDPKRLSTLEIESCILKSGLQLLP